MNTISTVKEENRGINKRKWLGRDEQNGFRSHDLKQIVPAFDSPVWRTPIKMALDYIQPAC